MFWNDYLYRLKRRLKVNVVKLTKFLLFSLRVHETPIVFRLYLRFWETVKVFRGFQWLNECREIMDYLMPENPLRAEKNQEMSVLILCHPKDINLLQSCIAGVELNVGDDVSEILVISPERIDLNQISSSIPIRSLLDTDVLSSDLRIKLEEKYVGTQYSWVLQQVIKITAALSLRKDFLLILDADTVLTKPRRFIAQGKQLLSISYEYHSPYIKHYKLFMPQHREFGISFVTHHQIWKGDVVQEIWGDGGLARWVDLGDPSQTNSMSEYHTYGNYLLNKYPDSISWARWGNKPISKVETISQPISVAISTIPTWVRPNSVSVHDYS